MVPLCVSWAVCVAASVPLPSYDITVSDVKATFTTLTWTVGETFGLNATRFWVHYLMGFEPANDVRATTCLIRPGWLVHGLTPLCLQFLYASSSSLLA